ncbi:Disease resistance protein [Quillaja saponaria]|uniref:Disease resistance protein n=1 Tax=Quillaja saponaria TaxID=32244 RepID=A0AAD7PGK0_QUISA|nr:Disease resistance protein [Quillaja saponaria]
MPACMNKITQFILLNLHSLCGLGKIKPAYRKQQLCMQKYKRSRISYFQSSGGNWATCCATEATWVSQPINADKLQEAKESLQHSVHTAWNNGEEIERAVVNWLGTVDEITVKLSRRVKKMAQDVVEIHAERNFEKISYSTKPNWIEMATTVAGYGFSETRAKISNEIMKELKDPSVKMIGVYGLGGVGKTTLVKNIGMKAQEEKLFDVYGSCDTEVRVGQGSKRNC